MLTWQRPGGRTAVPAVAEARRRDANTVAACLNAAAVSHPQSDATIKVYARAALQN